MPFDIEKWNKTIAEHIRKNGTWTVEIDGRILKMEVDCYKPDNSVDGYVAWWDDDHGMMTIGKTPYEAYSDHV